MKTPRPVAFVALDPLELLPEGPFGWAIVAALVVSAVAVALFLWRGHRAKRMRREHAAPPLIFPAASVATARTRTRPPPLVPSASAPPFPVPVQAYSIEPYGPASHGGNGDVAVETATSSAVAAASEESGTARSALFEGQTIKFHVPPDGTLQLLPGRLELVGGPDSGQVIRFVRGNGDPEVTFGRSDGPPYRHIQLRVPTVSRRHAQMRLDGSHWNIRNLSRTNPLVVNGVEVVSGADAQSLYDGDRIEMGELVFIYRER